MKATVNGITIEGTVQEICEFIKLYNGKQTIPSPYNPFNPFTPITNPNYIGDQPNPNLIPQITCKSGSTSGSTKSTEE